MLIKKHKFTFRRDSNFYGAQGHAFQAFNSFNLTKYIKDESFILQLLALGILLFLVHIIGLTINTLYELQLRNSKY